MTSPTALKTLAQPFGSERKLADLIPYRGMLDQHTVLLENGTLMQVIKLDGLNPEGKGQGEKASNLSGRLAALKLISRPDRAVHHHVIKRRVQTDNKPTASTDSSYITDLSDAYNQRVLGQPYVIEHYLTIFAKPPIDKINFLADLLASSAKRLAETQQANRRKHDTLNADVRRILGALTIYNPRVLGTSHNGEREFSEPLSFLYYLINHKTFDFPITDKLLNETLAGSRLAFPKGRAMRISRGVSNTTCFAASRSIKEFVNNEIVDGCLDPILALPFEFIISSSFAFYTRDYATKKIQLQANYLESSDDLAFSQQEDLDDALDELTSGDLSFGESSFVIFAFSDSEDGLAVALRDLEGLMDRGGFISVADDVAIEPNYRAMWPGCWRYRSRVWEGLNTKNWAALSTFHNAPVSRSANHWLPDKPIAQFTTTQNTQFDFNFHLDDLGNTVIVGQSGGGKTVLLTFLAAKAIESGARFIFFDKDQGARIFVEASGGNYTTIEEGRATGFNPFVDLQKSHENTNFITELIQTMIGLSGVTLSPDHFQIIYNAVQYAYDEPTASLSTVLEFLPTGDDATLHTALSRWCHGGQHAWLFDSQDTMTPFYEHDINGVDLTSILDNPNLLGLFIRYVFHITEKSLLDGRPFMVCADEGWRMLDTPESEAKLKNLAKVIRKLEGIFVFASNNPADLAKTVGGKEIVAQSPTKIFVPNPEGRPEDYEAYGLSPDQLSLILSQRKGARTFVLLQDETSQLLNFDLSSMPEHIAVLSTRKKSLSEISDLKETHGNAWLSHFMNAHGG